MAKYILGVLVMLTFLLAGIYRADSLDVTYKDGDAIYYKNRVIIASTDSGKLEIFSLGGERVEKIMTVAHPSQALRPKARFAAVKLQESSGVLTAYVVSGTTIFKFDISNLYEAALEQKVNNNLGDQYYGLSIEGNNLITIGSKGVSIWNKDLQIINAYNFEAYPGTASLVSKSLALGLSKDAAALVLYDRDNRTSKTVPLNFKTKPNTTWRVAHDAISGSIILVDDYYVKRFDDEGVLLGSLTNNGGAAYSVTTDAGLAYYTNGSALTKLDALNMQYLDSVDSVTVGGPGSRLMGLKMLETAFGPRLVVFAGNSISVVDASLKRIGYSGNISRIEEDLPSESLFLNLVGTSAIRGESVILNGGGFWPRENLILTLGDSSLIVRGDNSGRFNTEVFAPDTLATGMHDIKVTGEKSELTYSISLLVE